MERKGSSTIKENIIKAKQHVRPVTLSTDGVPASEGACNKDINDKVVDFGNGWDFSKSMHKTQAMAIIEKESPGMIVFHSSINDDPKNSNTIKAMQNKILHYDFIYKQCLKQHNLEKQVYM